MLKILIDARKLGDGGIGTYIENLVDSLIISSSNRSLSLKISLLVHPSVVKSKKFKPLLDSWRQDNNTLNLIPESSAKYSFSEYLLLPLRQRKIILEHDVFHSPHFTLPFFINIPSVVTVHDIIHINRPESLVQKILAPLLISSALKRASKVLFVSSYSKSEAQKHFNFDDSLSVVIPNALRKSFKLPKVHESKSFLFKNGIPKDFLLFVGSDRSHKGFDILINSLKKLKQKDPQRCKRLKLAVVGERFSSKTINEISNLGLKDNIIFLGGCSTEELNYLYFSANLVIVPSREEGFGLVALEALAAQTKLLCTPIPSLKEVCQDAASYSEDLSEKGLTESIEEILNLPADDNPKAAKSLLRARSFSLEKKGEAVLNEYILLSQKTDLRVPNRLQFGEKA